MTDEAKARLTPRIITDYAMLRQLWSSSDALHGNAQSFDWIDNWRRHVNNDSFVAGLFSGEVPVMMLPLEAMSVSGTRVLRYPGGTHANCNFPWLNRSLFALTNRSTIDCLIAEIGRARPDVDVITLTRQFQNLLGLDNPLLSLKSQKDHNPVLIASLDTGFDAVLVRSNSKRKLKKHRQHERRYVEAGGWRLYSPEKREESDQMLDTFFALKAHRLRQMGIHDPFAKPAVQAFFKELFGEAIGRENGTCELKALEVEGKIRSIIGKTFSKDGPTIEFNAIADDELMATSPGEFLFFEDIKNSCDAQLPNYSFGIGDEPYKREWCDIEACVYDTTIPLSVKGKAFTILQSLRKRLAATVKGNPRLWQFAKILRSKLSKR